MNSDVMTEARPEPQVGAEISPLRRFYWSVRRELWEHRSIYLAPLAVAALIVVGFTIGLVRLPASLRAAATLDAIHRSAAVEQPYTFAALLLMFVMMVIGIVYCLEALHGERRHRGVLFWKSLPVSDAVAVAAKASIPLVVLPLVGFVVTVVTQAIMLLLAGGRLVGTGLSVWSQLSFGRMAGILFVHLVLGHGLWYAPFWGWLLLVSAWSRRAPLLWAVLPPLAVGVVEKLAFGTSHFAAFLGQRLMGGPSGMASAGEPMTMASMTAGTPAEFLASPGFWLGLALTAACLVAAVRLRRHHGPL